MKLDRLFLRSVHGQLTLIAWTFVGGLGLAVLALCLRDVFFERYVYEKYPPLDEGQESTAGDLASGRLDAARFKERVEAAMDQNPQIPPAKFLEQRVAPLYGAWLNDPELDPADRLARSLISSFPDFIIDRLRRTLVAGSPAQRSRVLDFLILVEEPAQRAVARELCKYALERARRRHEPELARRASDTFDLLESSSISSQLERPQ